MLGAGNGLRNDIDNVRLSFEQLKNINTPEVVEDVRQQIQVFYEDAQERLDVIEECYLGDPKEIENLRGLMEQMRRNQDDFLDYAAAANRSEEEIVSYSTEHLDQVNALLISSWKAFWNTPTAGLPIFIRRPAGPASIPSRSPVWCSRQCLPYSSFTATC